jgi:hypothetical protein
MKIAISTFAAVLAVAIAFGIYIGIEAKPFGTLQAIWLASSLAMAVTMGVIVAFANWLVAKVESVHERTLQKRQTARTSRGPA